MHDFISILSRKVRAISLSTVNFYLLDLGPCFAGMQKELVPVRRLSRITEIIKNWITG